MRKAQVDNKQGLQGITGKFIDRYFHPGFGKQPSSKIQNFMLDVTCLVIQDCKSISQESFDSVPATIIELL